VGKKEGIRLCGENLLNKPPVQWRIINDQQFVR
jgi:hypothetical protein